MPNRSLIILGALEMSVKHTWGAINVRSSACGTRMTTRVCHAANDARLTMRRHCDQTHPASEAVGLCAAVTSHTSGVCPRLLNGHVPSPGTRIPVPDLAFGTYRPSLISTKPSFCCFVSNRCESRVRLRCSEVTGDPYPRLDISSGCHDS